MVIKSITFIVFFPFISLSYDILWTIKNSVSKDVNALTNVWHRACWTVWQFSLTHKKACESCHWPQSKSFVLNTISFALYLVYVKFMTVTDWRLLPPDNLSQCNREVLNTLWLLLRKATKTSLCWEVRVSLLLHYVLQNFSWMSFVFNPTDFAIVS